MEWLSQAIATGRMFDIIAIVMVVEAAGLWLYRRISGHGPGTREVLASIGAGFCLVVAFRVAMAGAATAWTLFFLSCALAAHVLDMERRLRR